MGTKPVGRLRIAVEQARLSGDCDDGRDRDEAARTGWRYVDPGGDGWQPPPGDGRGGNQLVRSATPNASGAR